MAILSLEKPFFQLKKPFFQESSIEKGSQFSPDGSRTDLTAGLETEAGELKLDEATAGGLGRHLGVFSTTFLVIGRIIGTGIFSTPSSVVKSTGSVGAALMLWALGFLLSIAGLSIWLEFGCMIPRSGGEKVYLEAVYKRPKLLITIFFAFQIILLGFTAAGCTVFASNVVLAANKKIGEWEERGIAIAMLTFVTVLHTCLPHWGVRGMNVIGLIKIGTLIFIVVSGWAVLGGAFKDRVADPHASFRNAFAGSSTSGNQYATALFKVLNSFAGWANATYVLNEVKSPVRTLKIAAPLGLGICGALYMFANISYFAAATPDEVAKSGVTVASHYMGKLFGTKGQQALSVLVAISAMGNVMTVTFAQSRVNQELAKEGVVPYPKFWASTWPFGSPTGGLFLHFIPSFIVIVAIPFGDAYNFILDVEGYPGSIIFLLVGVGFFLMRWKQPNLHRPFRVWIPVAVFFLAAQVFLITTPFLRPPGGKGDTSLPYWLAPVVGLIVLGCGVLYWAVWFRLLPRLGKYTLEPEKETLKDGTVVVVYKKYKAI